MESNGLWRRLFPAGQYILGYGKCIAEAESGRVLQTKIRPAQTRKDSSLLLVHTGRCSCQLRKLLSLTQAFKLCSDYSEPFICLGCWRISSRILPGRDVLEAIDLPEVALLDEITPRGDVRANRPDIVDHI